MEIPRIRKVATQDDSWEAMAQRRIGTEKIETVAAALRATGFSPAEYRTSNDDLRQYLLDDYYALLHFLVYCGSAHTYPIVPEPDGLVRLCKLKLPALFKAEVLASLLRNFIRPDGAFWHLPVGERKRLLGEYCKSVAAAASIYVIMGDSHSNLYTHRVAPIDYRGRLRIPLHVLCTGSSAKGLANRTSRSGAGASLASLAQSLPDNDMDLFFKFGQVDVEFVFNFDRIRAGQWRFVEDDFVRFCEQSTRVYLDFIGTHFAARTVNILSIFPPTLSDSAWREGYTNAHVVAVETEQQLEEILQGVRRLEIPSHRERTRHHNIYNEMLKTKSESAGFAFVDDCTMFVGSAGTVDPRYVSLQGGRDHHLDFLPAADMLIRLVYSYLSSREHDRIKSKRKHTNKFARNLSYVLDCFGRRP